MALADIRIESNSPIGRGAKIFIGDYELPGVQAISVDLNTKDVTLVSVTLVADTLKMNFPAALEVMVALQQEGLISLVPESSADADS